jgi:predicted Fe-S protein YdhL (DUF1289 family)
MNIESPCINICRIAADRGYCEGCFRSLDEIAAWRGADDTGKRAILLAAAQRRAAAERSAQGVAVDAGAGRSRAV